MNPFSKKKPTIAAEVLKGDFTIDPTVQILGLAAVRIGQGSVIGEYCWLNVNTPYEKGIAISIGSHCFIGRRNFFNSGTMIEVGDYGLTGPDCHFLGSDHSIEDPFRPYVGQASKPRGEIRLGPNCWLGSRVTILGPSRVGYGSVIGANALVKGDVPPLSIVIGSPAVVVKRYSPSKEAWIKAEEFGDEVLPDEEEYLAKLKSFSRPRLPVIASGSSQGSQ